MKTDVELQRDVMDELKWEPLLEASEIGVAVKNGVVTLSGIVDTYAKKVRAEQAAKRIPGVKAVAEDIVVKVGGTGVKSDTEIAQAVVNALAWHSAVKEDKVKIKVEDGWVTLNGEVEWEYQRTSIRNIVENLLGVKGITNNIVIIPRTNVSDLISKINSAFHRRANLDLKRIQVNISGSKAILNGKVHSLIEKKDAEDAVWFAPGINAVENNLEVVEEEELAYGSY